MDMLLQLQLANTLASLHQKAEAEQVYREAERKKSVDHKPAFNQNQTQAHLSVSAREGYILHLLASITQPKLIVEFGCAFGLSTIYLAMAAKDNGGKVITTEIDPDKVARATTNISEAGLGDVVQIIEGDARETLRFVQGDIDFLFLRGAREMYLPILQMLLPQMHKNAIIVADCTNQSDARPFVDYILREDTVFTTFQLFNNRALVSCII